MSSLKTIFESAYADLLKEVTPLDAADNLYPRPRNWGLYQFLPPERDRDDDDIEALAVSYASSFGFAGFTTVSPGVSYMELYGGGVRYNGRFTVSMEDTHPASEDPELAETGIQITGTLAAPTYICLQMNKSDANDCSFVGLASDPEDNGTHWYRVLHTAYLDDSGSPVYLKDRRHDWNLGSPIR